jgi:peptidoglycan/LPS O-acetylase OafA/YrhL
MWEKLGLKINFDNERIYGLDMMRAFAISIVVVTHSISYLPNTINDIIRYIDLDGVSIFFVLSGFLIGRILIKSMSKAEPDFKTLFDFWIRRWLRTLPIYFLILSLLLFVHGYPNFAGPTNKMFYIFSENIYQPHPGFFIESWSLSVEEWFYLLIPLLTFIFVKYFKIKVHISILIIAVGVILFSTVVRLERYLTRNPFAGFNFEQLIRTQVITRIDSLIYGVLGALYSYFYYKKWIASRRLKFMAGVSILIISKALILVNQNEALTFYNTIFSLSMNAIGTLFLLPFLSEYKYGRGVLFKMVTYLSLISYSMYLINLTPVQGYVLPFINNHILKNLIRLDSFKWIDLVFYYPITIFSSIYLYKFVEKPFLSFRDKLNFPMKVKIAKIEHV